MALAKKCKLTYEEYRALPDDGNRYMLFDGELIMTPAPRPQHQRVIRKILYSLTDYMEENPIGEVFAAPLDVLLIPGVAKAWQPDIVYVSRERQHIVTEDDIQGAPDLVVEVVSPGSYKDDLGRKKRAYQEAGVREYWVVWQDMPRIEVFRLSDAGRYRDPHLLEAGDTLTTDQLPGFSLALDRLYAGLPGDNQDEG